MLIGGAVSWKSSKQSAIVNSTIEFKFIAFIEVTMETIWIKKFIAKLGVVFSIIELIELLRFRGMLTLQL